MLYGWAQIPRKHARGCLNPYFFGKCSTAAAETVSTVVEPKCLNPYFFGKCSTAEDETCSNAKVPTSLNPYFFGKCSTAREISKPFLRSN